MINAKLYLEKIEEYLSRSLPECVGELCEIPEMLSYSLTSGGKRIRPLLCLEFCAACGGDINTALPFAAAVEFIHTYSLVHDDMPCMDNDDYRRGKLASHKKYGEANALLVGDALLTHSFAIISRAAINGEVDFEKAIRAVDVLSTLAGAVGMIGGQYLDIFYENKKADAQILFAMDRGKTSALIEAACVTGVIAAGGGENERIAACEFAVAMGIAFQITDDLIEYDSGETSDEANGKATYITEFGVKKSRELAAEYTEKAIAALDVFGEKANEIKQLANELLTRAVPQNSSLKP